MQKKKRVKGSVALVPGLVDARRGDLPCRTNARATNRAFVAAAAGGVTAETRAVVLYRPCRADPEEIGRREKNSAMFLLSMNTGAGGARHARDRPALLRCLTLAGSAPATITTQADSHSSDVMPCTRN